MNRFLVLLAITALVACQTGGGISTGGTDDFPQPARPQPNVPSRPTARMSPLHDLNTVYFDYDDSRLRVDARETLRTNAQALSEKPDLRVTIEGHCDERGSNEYNLALGNRRANAAKMYLIDLGIDTSRLRTLSYGEERPAVRGHTEVAWEKNRRGVFVPN